jgi:hypothetical protein
MAKPKLYLLGPGRYAYRVDFRFVSPEGKLLRSKTWEIRREGDEEPRVQLLQANAKLLGDKPKLDELGPNYVAITVAVDAVAGGLATAVLMGLQPEPFHRQVAAFPLTISIIVGPDGLNFSLYTAAKKS